MNDTEVLEEIGAGIHLFAGFCAALATGYHLLKKQRMFAGISAGMTIYHFISSARHHKHAKRERCEQCEHYRKS